jgi:hypothetical protein
VAGDVDGVGDLLGPQDPVDVGGHGADGVQDGGVGQGPLVGADAFGEPVAQVVVGEQGRPAVGVVDDRDFEVRAFGGLGVDQVTDVGDIGDDGRGDAAANVALDDGLTEFDAEDLGRVDAGVDAGDDVQIQVRDERQPGHALAGARIGGEGPVAVQERGDVRQG